MFYVYNLLTDFIVEYRGLGHGDERDIFQRVQMGMPLAAAGDVHPFALFATPAHVPCRKTAGDFLALVRLDLGTKREDGHIGHRHCG